MPLRERSVPTRTDTAHASSTVPGPVHAPWLRRPHPERPASLPPGAGPTWKGLLTQEPGLPPYPWLTSEVSQSRVPFVPQAAPGAGLPDTPAPGAPPAAAPCSVLSPHPHLLPARGRGRWLPTDAQTTNGDCAPETLHTLRQGFLLAGTWGCSPRPHHCASDPAGASLLQLAVTLSEVSGRTWGQ